MKRARPSESARDAVFFTAPKVQPPPIQPITVPTPRITALAPSRSEAPPATRTTVAAANNTTLKMLK